MALRAEGANGSWNCSEWAGATRKPFKKLPEHVADDESDKQAKEAPPVSFPASAAETRARTAVVQALQATFQKAAATHNRRTALRLTDAALAKLAAALPPETSRPLAVVRAKLAHDADLVGAVVAGYPHLDDKNVAAMARLIAKSASEMGMAKGFGVRDSQEKHDKPDHKGLSVRVGHEGPMQFEASPRDASSILHKHGT